MSLHTHTHTHRQKQVDFRLGSCKTCPTWEVAAATSSSSSAAAAASVFALVPAAIKRCLTAMQQIALGFWTLAPVPQAIHAACHTPLPACHLLGVSLSLSLLFSLPLCVSRSLLRYISIVNMINHHTLGWCCCYATAAAAMLLLLLLLSMINDAEPRA